MSKPGTEDAPGDAAPTNGGTDAQRRVPAQGLRTAHGGNQSPGTARSRALCRSGVGKWGARSPAPWRRRNRAAMFAPEVSMGALASVDVEKRDVIVSRNPATGD